MPDYKRTIRRGQAVTPYGPGAIITGNGESFIACNAEQWRNQGEHIHEVRLQKMLGREHFRLAPAAPEDNKPHPHLGVPVVRFPDWLFCNRCNQMLRWSERSRPADTQMDVPYCRRCQVPLIPMRFVMACAHGHIADAPWDQLCHGGQPCPRGPHNLRFRTGGQRAGLEDLRIECAGCGASYSLAGITRKDALRGIISGCPGRQPWESAGQACTLFPRVMLRGATSIHFAKTKSSIDIPPYSAPTLDTALVDRIMASSEYGMVEGSDDVFIRNLAKRLVGRLQQDFPEVTIDRVLEVFKGQTTPAGNKQSVPAYDSEQDLKREEYRVFLAPYQTTDPRDTFQKKDVSITDARRLGDEHREWNRLVEAVGGLIDRLVLITKLREVRVVTDFSRLGSEGTAVDAVLVANGTTVKEPVSLVPVASRTLDWLPAAEVFGEGIFFTLSTPAIQQWMQQHPDVLKRANVLRQRQASLSTSLGQTAASVPFLLLHTLTHLLIRQLSFTSGYGSSSVRERLYCELDAQGNILMCGALIYTAAGDSEGTLGGLVRRGYPLDFITTLTDALRNALWCSSDPLCQDSRGQGRNALNLAACHACSLLPETSCAEWNSLLDRALVVGLTENPQLGYFAPVLDAVTL